MADTGMRAEDIAAALECGRSTVFGWLAAYRNGGKESLKVKVASGRPTKLSPQQEATLYALLKKSPQQLEFDFGLWTRKMVAELVLRRFDVELSPVSVGRLLRRMGMSPQRPIVRAYEQDPEAVRRWKTEEYPAIRAEAAAQGASVFFADEAGIRSDYHSGTTWAPVGETPVVYGTGNRVSVNMASAVSARGALHFMLFEGSLNAMTFIEFLEKLLHDIEGKIFLIVDGLPVHKAKAVTEFVKSTEGRLRLIFLPPYSPELNPDEWVWKNVKHDNVGKSVVKGKADLMEAATRALERLKMAPQKVLAFFRDPHLSYIGA
jgi:transposase